MNAGVSSFVAPLKGFRTKQGNIRGITIPAGNTGYKGVGKGTPPPPPGEGRAEQGHPEQVPGSTQRTILLAQIEGEGLAEVSYYG